MKQKNILFLFAPKFREFAIDIINKILEESPDLKVAGICMGGERVLNCVKDNLPEENIYGLWDIEDLEWNWVTDKNISLDILGMIDDQLGSGACGKIITADRRIGGGYVRGGVCRPDDLGERVKTDSVFIPIKYLEGLYKFNSELFSNFKPDVVFCYAVASAPAVMLALMCNQTKVKFLRFSPSRIGKLYVIDEDYKGRLSCVNQSITSESHSIDGASRRMAVSYLEAYRKKPIQPDYAIYVRNLIKSSRASKILLEAIKMNLIILQDFIAPKKIKRVSFIQVKRKLFELGIELKKKRYLNNVFDQDLPPFKYVYFPLHVDPEATTMVLSHMHTDQLAVIEAISKSLPGDRVLVVKDHIPMLGLRPKGFYETLKKMPRVCLIHPYYESLDLIKSSEAVITITGTASLEAILLQKKTIIIGDHPILMIKEGFIYEPSLSNLPSAFAKLDELELASDETIIRFLSATFQNSFEMNDALLWGSYIKCDEKMKREAVEIISHKILYHIDQ